MATSIPCLLAALALPACVAAPAGAQVLQAGNRFLVAWPDTARNLPPRVPGSSAEATFEDLAWIVVFAERATPISVRSADWSLDTVVAADRSTIVKIPAAARRFATRNLDVDSAAYEITAEHPVSLVCYYATSYGAEAFTPLPVGQWGTDYTVPGIPSERILDDLTFTDNEEGKLREVYAPGEFVVIAAENGTVVTIDATANLGEFSAWRRKVTVTLDAGETYLVQPGAPPAPEPRPREPKLAFGTSDLARTRVTSTRPIGIIAANTRTLGANWPPGLFWTGNSLKNAAAEWLAPRAMNGTRHAYLSPWVVDDVVPQDRIRIYATAKGNQELRTNLTSERVQLGVGQMRQYSVAQYFGADGSFWSSSTDYTQVTAVGGPLVWMDDAIASEGIRALATASVDLVPQERWGDYTRFHVPDYPAGLRHVFTLVAEPGAELVLDDTVTIIDWTGMLNAPYRSVRMEIAPGDHRIVSTGGRFSGTVAGRMSGYEAYRPLKSRDRDEPPGGLMHAAAYHERISVGYAYPLIPGYAIPDSFDVATAEDCHGMLVEVVVAHASAGASAYRLSVIDSLNARVSITPRRRGAVVIGWDVEIGAIDSTKPARGIVDVFSPFGTSRSIPYRYDPPRPSVKPLSIELYDVFRDVVRPIAVELGNGGDTTLAITSARLVNGTRGFSLAGGALPGSLAPSATAPVALTFVGTSYATYYYDTLLIEGPCWSLRVPLEARTRAFLPEPLPRITTVDWRERWVTTRSACTKSGIAAYDSAVTIANRGTRAFVVVALELEGADAAAFALDSSDAAASIGYGDIVYPDSVISTPVRFMPSEEREYRCRVRLVTQDRDTVVGELIGRGVESHVGVEPDPLDLGGTLFRGAGVTIARGSATVRALPTRTLTVTAIAIEGAMASSFAIDRSGGFVAPEENDPSTWWRLAPGESREVPVLFAPQQSGEAAARLVVRGDHSRCDDSVGAIVARSWRALAELEPPALMVSAECDATEAFAVLTNTGPEPIVLVGARIEPTGGPFSLSLDGLPRTLASGERLEIPVTFAPADTGESRAMLHVDLRDTSGSYVIEIAPAELRGRAAPDSIALSIGRAYRLISLGSSMLEVILDETPIGRTIDRAELAIAIEPKLFRALGVSTGEQTAGWTLDVRERSDTLLRVTLDAPVGRRLTGPGSVLRIAVLGHYSPLMQTDVPFTAAFPAERCLIATTTPGHLRIDSICGLSTRWMETFGMLNRVEHLRVSEDGSRATVAFTLALDGPVVVELVDMRGSIVAVVADAELRAGRHEIEVDARGMATGAYFVRVRAGEWVGIAGR